MKAIKATMYHSFGVPLTVEVSEGSLGRQRVGVTLSSHYRVTSLV